MYYYLVDPSKFGGKNFEFFQTQLLALLGEYHIAGEVARATKLRTVEDLVSTAISHGVGTLVIVGSDETFYQAVTFCRGKALTLGYISIGELSEVARILGIGQLEDAVATIAKRRVEELDLAKIGETHFISELRFGFLPEKFFTRPYGDPSLSGFSLMRSLLKISPQEVVLSFDKKFSASSPLIAASIINTRDHGSENPGVTLGNPRDQLLDVVLAGDLSRFSAWRYRKFLARKSFEALPGSSAVHTRSVEILAPEGLPIYLSGHIVANAPAKVTVSEYKIKVIVGKGRVF